LSDRPQLLSASGAEPDVRAAYVLAEKEVFVICGDCWVLVRRSNRATDDSLPRHLSDKCHRWFAAVTNVTAGRRYVGALNRVRVLSCTLRARSTSFACGSASRWLLVVGQSGLCRIPRSTTRMCCGSHRCQKLLQGSRVLLLVDSAGVADTMSKSRSSQFHAAQSAVPLRYRRFPTALQSPALWIPSL